MAFTTDRWIGAASADWGASAANWSKGLPGSNSNVVIDTASALTVSYGAADNFTVHSLAVGDDLLDITGGSLTITTTASLADGFTQTGGILTAGGAVKVKGMGVLTGGAAAGHTAFRFGGHVSLAHYRLGGAASLSNDKTTDLDGQITLGDNTGDNAAIDNKRGGVFDITGDFGISRGAASARFVNAGTLEKTAGTGTSFIQVSFTDTGKLVIASGTLEFDSPDNSFAGRITGAGRLVLGAASKDVIAGGTTITTASFTILGAVTLDGDLGYAGSFTLQSPTLDLASATLTLAGTNALKSSALHGNGLLVTPHGSNTTVNGLIFGGTNIWENSGVVEAAGPWRLGDASFGAATFINEKAGKYVFANDAGIAIGSAFGSSFQNLGTLKKMAGTGTSIIQAAVTDSGVVLVRSGTLAFAGLGNSFAGRIAGAGAFEIAGGANVIGSGTRIRTAGFGIVNSGTVVALGENLRYAGTFDFGNGGALNSGPDLDLDRFTLTLSGSDTFSGVFFDGTGKLVTTAGSRIGLGNVVLGGALVWENSGSIVETNPLQIGDTGFDVAKFINKRGGAFDIAADYDIRRGTEPSSSFVNSAGAVVAKTGGSRISKISVDFTNNGSVLVESGEIEFASPVRGTGSFTIDPGAVLQFDTGVAKGSRVAFSAKTGGQLTLFESSAFGAAIRGFGGANTDRIDLRDINFISHAFQMSFDAAADILTVTDGSRTAKLAFFGKYTLDNFHASADGRGGTLIVDPTVAGTLLASGR